MEEGQILDRKYRIVRELGRGGMGAVYEAVHTGTGRRVALKVIVTELAKGADVITRFQREARASGSIDSQHVVQVLDTGVDPVTTNPYMVMEYLAGEDVHQLVGRVGALPPELALKIIAQACLGLGRAHDAGIIHRDIKSANIYLARRDGGEIFTKLLDFGIAKVRADQFSQTGGHGLTRTGSMLGSPLYMSPEQAMGLKDLDGRSDIWSLGIVLYEALSGQTPNGHCETIGQLLVAIASGKYKPIQEAAPWVTPEVATIVQTAMAQEPGNRYPTVADMYRAIVALLPSGVAIHENMIAGVPEAVRSRAAPQLLVTPGEPSASSSGISPYASTTTGATSAPGVGNTAVADPNGDVAGIPKRSSAATIGIATLAAVLALGGVGYGVHRYRSADATPGDPALGPVVSAAASSAPVIASSTQRTVEVAVSPANATITLDGVATVPTNGRVTIRGDVGSVHRITVSSAGHDMAQDVVIAETGPIPAHVDLDVHAVGAGTALGSPSHRVNVPPPASGAAPSAAPSASAALPPPTVTAHATTKPPPTTPTVDRSM